MLRSFWVLCGGDYGGVVFAREIAVAVREVDRSVLVVDVDTDVGLINLCVESDWPKQPRHSTPLSRGAGVTSGHSQRCRG